MAQVRLTRIIERHPTEFRHALTEAVQELLPDAEFDEHELLRIFTQRLDRRFSTWQTVPDDTVRP